MSPYIKQTRLVFKGLNNAVKLCTYYSATSAVSACSVIVLYNAFCVCVCGVGVVEVINVTSIAVYVS